MEIFVIERYLKNFCLGKKRSEIDVCKMREFAQILLSVKKSRQKVTKFWLSD